jgi:hypothetical protein
MCQIQFNGEDYPGEVYDLYLNTKMDFTSSSNKWDVFVDIRPNFELTTGTKYYDYLSSTNCNLAEYVVYDKKYLCCKFGVHKTSDSTVGQTTIKINSDTEYLFGSMLNVTYIVFSFLEDLECKVIAKGLSLNYFDTNHTFNSKTYIALRANLLTTSKLIENEEFSNASAYGSLIAVALSGMSKYQSRFKLSGISDLGSDFIDI